MDGQGVLQAHTPSENATETRTKDTKALAHAARILCRRKGRIKTLSWLPA
ncbi:hypothetical protein [Phaeobacter phage MD18]|nr:hypothetical protein [Phaeobacter phage MD18]